MAACSSVLAWVRSSEAWTAFGVLLVAELLLQVMSVWLAELPAAVRLFCAAP